MTFFRTEMLFFIWAVPVLFLVIVYGTRRRREIMHRFSSAHGLDVIAPDTVGSRRWVKASLLMGTVLFTAVALAQDDAGRADVLRQNTSYREALGELEAEVAHGGVVLGALGSVGDGLFKNRFTLLSHLPLLRFLPRTGRSRHWISVTVPSPNMALNFLMIIGTSMVSSCRQAP